MTRALVASGPGELEVQDVTLRALGDDDVRVRIAGVGVCHSDLSMVNGTLRPSYPLVLGHEASGVVTEAGAGAGVEVGQPRRPQLGGALRHLLALHARPAVAVLDDRGQHRDAGRHARRRHAVRGLPRARARWPRRSSSPRAPWSPLPDDVPLEEAALLGCAILTGVGAAQNAGRVQPVTRCWSIGLGGVGLSAVAGRPARRRRSDHRRDVSESKEPLARTAGATDFLVASPDLAKQVRALTEGRGADVALECVGSATTIRQAWTAVRRGGTCVVVGVGPKDQQVTFNPLELFHFSRTLVSSVYGNSDPARDIAGLLDHVARRPPRPRRHDHRPDHPRRRPGRVRADAARRGRPCARHLPPTSPRSSR